MEDTKKMTPWRLERLQSTGELRCARNEVGNDKSVQYERVPVPAFTPVEMAAMTELCKAMQGDVRSIDLAEFCYDARYNRNARHLLERLTAEAAKEPSGK